MERGRGVGAGHASGDPLKRFTALDANVRWKPPGNNGREHTKIMTDFAWSDPAAAEFLVQLLTRQLPLARAIVVATELSIADHLGDGEHSVAQLAEMIGADEQNLYRLLQLLSVFGVFKELEPGRFENTNISNMMRKSKVDSLRDMILWNGGSLTWRSLEGLGACVRSGRTAFEEVFGAPFFSYLERHPFHKKIFFDGLRSFTQMIIPGVLKSYDFSRFHRVVDVGGGEGDLIVAIHERYPNVDCTLFDRVEVVSELRGARLQNIGLVGGDFFSEPLPAADCYILQMIIHDWSDQDGVRILRHCRDSLTEDGRVIVIEMVLNDNSPHETFTRLLDLDMMILTGGKERTTDGYRALFDAAGLELCQIISTGAPLSIMEARRAMSWRSA
jgi:hypothetical protein